MTASARLVFLWSFLAAVTLCAQAPPAGAAARAQARRPNVLLVVADDMRPDVIRALGNNRIQTPALDGLVRRGVTFTRAIAPNPICTPSRAELLTGCTSFRNGVTFFNEPIRTDLPLLPGVLRESGYRTWYVGKWHNDGTPTERGYEEARRVFKGGMGDHQMEFTEAGGKVTGYSSRLFADAAISFLERRSPEPFFLHVNFTAPHDPRTVPPGYEDRYTPSRMLLPPNFRPEHPFDNGDLRLRDEQLLPWPRTGEAIRRELATYYAMVTHLDEQVGRMLSTLDQNGAADNTVVIFTSDHGLALGSHGLLGKQNMYEHSIGTPLIVRGPGVASGRRVAAQCYLRDLYPTICDIAGARVSPVVQARTLAPLLTGDGRGGGSYPFVCGYYRDAQRMIRTDRWKLISYPKINRVQLFDLRRDPNEMTDLSAKPEHAARREELRGQLREWQLRNGDPLVTAG